MEWHCLAVSVVILQMTVYEVSLANESVTSRNTFAFCNPNQNFICLNLTHYTPCLYYEGPRTSRDKQKQYYCGDQRCCRPGAVAPCGLYCQGPIFPPEEYVLMWNFRQFKKKIRKHVPLDSEEIERRNKIISVKNFIVRQKDLEISEEDYLDEMEWKPSYRTFCPANKPWVEPTTTTTLETKPSSGGCGGGSGGCCGGGGGCCGGGGGCCGCCCCCCCCSGCQETTIQSNTTTTATPQMTTTNKRSQNVTKRTKPTRRTRRTVRPTKSKPKPNIACKKHGQKIRDPNNCAHYYLCTEKNKGNFEVHKKFCPLYHFFSVEKQKCLPMEEVECDI